MSLSAPELGSIEPDRTMLRAWVSSTELLHERAMARFYQAAAEEEAEKSLRRRYSVERRSSFRGRELPQYIRKKSVTGSEESLRDKLKYRLSLPDESLLKGFEITGKQYQSVGEENKKSNDVDSNQMYLKGNKESADKLPKMGRFDPLSSEEVQRSYKKEIIQTQRSEEDENSDLMKNRKGYFPQSSSNERSSTGISKTGRFQPQNSEEEEEKQSVQESGEEDISEESEIEDEEYMAEAEEDYEIEEEFEEELEEEVEEEEEIDDIDMLGESEGEYERSRYSIEEETYHPRNMTPKSGMVTTITPASPAVKQRRSPTTSVIDNLESATNVATAIVSHSIQIPIKSEAIPTKSLLKPPQMTKPTVRIEVTPPPADELKVSLQISTKDVLTENRKEKQADEPKKHIIKPIIKKSPSPAREGSPSSVQFKLVSDQKEKDSNELTVKRQFSPPRFTPDGRHLPNLNPPIPKPILKVREHSQEKIAVSDKKKNNLKPSTAPLAAVEPELNIITKHERMEIKSNNEINNLTDSYKLKKKQVRIEEPLENIKSYDIDESDIGITVAGDIARSRRRSPRSSPLMDASDPTKCLIHHYSDIVKEFGRVRKVPTTLYLNYEDLKAAAQKSEDNLFDPILGKEEDRKTGKEENNEIFENQKESSEVTEKSLIKMADEEGSRQNEYIDYDVEGQDKEEKEMEFLMESPEIKEIPNLILLSEVISKEQNGEEIPEELWAETQGRKEEIITKIAEKKVRTAVDYMTDLAMFLIACWLYAFSDEKLAIPILILMVYRQVKEAAVSYFKKQIAKLPKLPKLPWKKD